LLQTVTVERWWYKFLSLLGISMKLIHLERAAFKHDISCVAWEGSSRFLSVLFRVSDAYGLTLLGVCNKRLIVTKES